ncbi:hypothetical protein AB17_1317 [Escherichia coli 3-105-05_S1_C1]|nr:hypothetical protein AB17_1317 [Escherichia coli 3-105-05_S1_C1]
MFPAPAGINRINNNPVAPCISVPRASGDKPVIKNILFLLNQCSPRQRG